MLQSLRFALPEMLVNGEINGCGLQKKRKNMDVHWRLLTHSHEKFQHFQVFSPRFATKWAPTFLRLAPLMGSWWALSLSLGLWYPLGVCFPHIPRRKMDMMNAGLSLDLPLSSKPCLQFPVHCRIHHPSHRTISAKPSFFGQALHNFAPLADSLTPGPNQGSMGVLINAEVIPST